MTPEGKVKAKLKARLRKEWPNMYSFMPVQSGYGAKTLDFLCSIEGRFVAFETKAPGKHPTPLQASTIEDILHAGSFACVVSDDDTIDAAIALIHLWLRFGQNGGSYNGHVELPTAQDEGQGKKHLRQ